MIPNPEKLISSVTQETYSMPQSLDTDTLSSSKFNRRDFLKAAGGAGLATAIALTPTAAVYAAHSSTGTGDHVDYIVYTVKGTFPATCPAPADDSFSDASAKHQALNMAYNNSSLSMDGVSHMAQFIAPRVVNAWQGTAPTDADIEFVPEPGYPITAANGQLKYKYHILIKRACGPFTWNVNDESV